MKKRYIILTSLAACIALYFVDLIFKTSYAIRTIVKIIFFTGIPVFYNKVIMKSSVEKNNILNKLDKKQLRIGVLFGIASFTILIIAYNVLRDIINFQAIVIDLQTRSKVTPRNFTLIGAYITFGNSFLEEFFFRGFIFLNLYKLNYKKVAYLYSSVLFGVYHISIFQTWFNTWLIMLSLFGLISIAIVFNWLDTKSDNFINSWIVHILADSAIILIGFRIFGMI